MSSIRRRPRRRAREAEQTLESLEETGASIAGAPSRVPSVEPDTGKIQSIDEIRIGAATSAWTTLIPAFTTAASSGYQVNS